MTTTRRDYIGTLRVNLLVAADALNEAMADRDWMDRIALHDADIVDLESEVIRLIRLVEEAIDPAHARGLRHRVTSLYCSLDDPEVKP